MTAGAPIARSTAIRLADRGEEDENGAGDEIRTHDINLGKVALYP